MFRPNNFALMVALLLLTVVTGAIQARAVDVDASNSLSVFANATDVVPAERHVIFNFGVMHVGENPIAPTTTVRVYMNYFTAKRMQQALQMSIDRHEGVFGRTGVDVPVKMTTPPEVGRHPEYANFVRLTGSPEELILELGLNRTPVGVPKNPIPIRHTVVMDFVTGNTLLEQLTEEIKQYETANGTIEIDANKRVINKQR